MNSKLDLATCGSQPRFACIEFRSSDGCRMHPSRLAKTVLPAVISTVGGALGAIIVRSREDCDAALCVAPTRRRTDIAEIALTGLEIDPEKLT